ncbi:plastocyanin [Halarchaeum rubridurum]|uniref:Plastocyanin n=1 Tax=Halarchaeum rubridurum TaxID=489911 RepID=A0A830G5J6_9EURY|nr:hypothetical protein [Halarchaeum rubridurum]MBP1955632.1 plastocyanin [Halarchaeum rubridurum]GGM76398.1 hypothetical protein GCM10009017_27760 [Halarchaeum rubridurum]
MIRRRYVAILVTLLVVAGTVAPAGVGATTGVQGSSGGADTVYAASTTNTTQLSVSAAGTPTAGAETTFTVTNATSGDPVADATITADDGALSATTGADGNATLTFGNATGYTVTANKSDTSSTDYQNGTTQVSVEKRTVQLDVDGFSAYTDYNYTIGAGITFSIKDPNGNNIAGTLEFGDRTVEFQKGGSETVYFQNPGEYTLTFSKNDTESVHYVDWTQDITVTKNQHDLTLSRNVSSNFQPGDAVRFTLKDRSTSGQVNGTLHVTANDTTENVSIDGTADYTFDETGNYTVTATKNETAEVNFTASDPLAFDVSKQQYQLTFSQSPGHEILPNSTHTVNVKDGHTGLVNVTLHYGDVTTALNGSGDVTFNETGQFTLTATKNDTAAIHYVNATYALNVSKETHELYFSTDPTSNGPIRPNESVKVGVTDRATSGAVNVTLHYGNETQQLNATENRMTFDGTGNYTLTATKNDTAQTNYTAAGPLNVTVSKRVDPLTFSATPPSPIEPGANATFTVKNGYTSSQTNVTLHYGNETTPLNGTGDVVFEEGGNYTVTATKNATEQVRYANATYNLTVASETVALNLYRADSSGTVSPGENFTVGAKYDNSTLAANVTLVAGPNRTLRTNENGMATLNYTAGENHTIRTAMNDTRTIDYVNDTLNVTLSPVVFQPKLSVVTSSPSPNNTTVFSVVASGSGNPISNASLYANGTRIGQTNASGLANHTFTEIGQYPVTVSKNATDAEYLNDTTNVTVRYQGIQLVLERTSTSEIQVGDVAAFRVTQAVTGEPVKDATVYAPNDTDTTDANGVAYIRFNATGVHRLSSEKSGDGTNTWRVAGTRVDVKRCIVGLNATVNDTRVAVGENVTVNVTRRVAGTNVSDVALFVGNRTVTAGEDGTATLNFSEPGEYTITANRTDAGGRDFVNDTVALDVRNATSGPALDLTFDGADHGATTVNETTTANLTLSEVPDGLSGFEANLTIANASAASFNLSETTTAFALSNATRVDANTIRVRAVDLDNTTTAGDEDVHLASVAIDGEGAALTEVSVTDANVDAENGSAVNAVPDGADLLVEQLAPVVNDATPTDTNDDGVYDDVNGNGETDFNDVVTLYDNMNEESVTDHAEKFDWNDNGKVDFDDIVSLYNEV